MSSSISVTRCSGVSTAAPGGGGSCHPCGWSRGLGDETMQTSRPEIPGRFPGRRVGSLTGPAKRSPPAKTPPITGQTLAPRDLLRSSGRSCCLSGCCAAPVAAGCRKGSPASTTVSYVCCYCRSRPRHDTFWALTASDSHDMLRGERTRLPRSAASDPDRPDLDTADRPKSCSGPGRDRGRRGGGHPGSSISSLAMTRPAPSSCRRRRPFRVT
jgi:hypothetical protein